MKRIFTVIFLLALTAASALAQISDADASKLKTIADKSANLKTLSCKFRQVQESPMLKTPEVSTGMMQFISSGKLVWKYETPKLFQLSLLEDKIVMTSDKGAKTMQLSDNPMMAQMKDLFMGLVNGSNLRADGDRFECSVKDSGDVSVVTMVPKARQLKKMFSSLEFTFKGPDCLISKVVLLGSGGGKTTVTFTEHQITRK